MIRRIRAFIAERRAIVAQTPAGWDSEEGEAELQALVAAVRAETGSGPVIPGAHAARHAAPDEAIDTGHIPRHDATAQPRPGHPDHEARRRRITVEWRRS